MIVSGAAVFENGSVSDCPALRSLRGEGQASAITLKSQAISQCGNLETVLLDGAFASVASDAVVQAKRFKGFTLADGCDAFDVRGGVLLVENKAYIQEGMGEALLQFGGGQLGSLRIDGDPASSAWLLFADPNVNVSVEGGLKNVRALYAGSEETYFSCGASIEAELGHYRVVANLPYYVTTPVMMRFLEEASCCDGVTVMVQEEVADRFTAQAGTPEYGAVTAAIALRGEARIVRRVPRTMFTPRPNVDSAVVRIDFEQDRIPVQSVGAYRAVVRCAFSGRRKTLENNLMNTFRLSREQAKEMLSEAGIADMARGETLTPAQFARLADVLTEHRCTDGQ